MGVLESNNCGCGRWTRWKCRECGRPICATCAFKGTHVDFVCERCREQAEAVGGKDTGQTLFEGEAARREM